MINKLELEISDSEKVITIEIGGEFGSTLRLTQGTPMTPVMVEIIKTKSLNRVIKAKETDLFGRLMTLFLHYFNYTRFPDLRFISENVLVNASARYEFELFDGDDLRLISDHSHIPLGELEGVKKAALSFMDAREGIRPIVKDFLDGKAE